MQKKKKRNLYLIGDVDMHEKSNFFFRKIATNLLSQEDPVIVE